MVIQDRRSIFSGLGNYSFQWWKAQSGYIKNLTYYWADVCCHEFHGEWVFSLRPRLSLSSSCFFPPFPLMYRNVFSKLTKGMGFKHAT